MRTDADDIGYLFKTLSDRIQASVDRSLAELGLTFSQVQLLELLMGREAALSPSDLEERLGVSQPTVTGLVKRLEAKGFLRTGVDPTDRRRRIVRITSEGRAVMDEALEQRVAHMSRLLEGLTEAQVAQLRELLVGLIGNLGDRDDRAARPKENAPA